MQSVNVQHNFVMHDEVVNTKAMQGLTEDKIIGNRSTWFKDDERNRHCVF